MRSVVLKRAISVGYTNLVQVVVNIYLEEFENVAA